MRRRRAGHSCSACDRHSWQALQAKSDLQFARESLANYQKTVDINRQMFQQGEISRADFLRIELQTLQFQTDLDDAILELKTAKAALRGLLGTANLPDDFDVDGELKAQPFDKDLAELKQLALQNRPDLKSAETGREKAAADLRLTQANRWPDPTIGASYLHTGSELPGPQLVPAFLSQGQFFQRNGRGNCLDSDPDFQSQPG